MIRLIGCSCWIVLLALPAFGQSAPTSMAFEVASVKSHNGPLTHIADLSSSGTRLTLLAFPVIELVMEAYNLKRYQVSFEGSVPQDDSIYYDIVAKAAGGGTPTRSEFRQMLQTLLAERFHLKVHHEMKEIPVYGLVVGKHGPKFQESATDVNAINNHGVNGRYQTVKATKYTMALLAVDIGNYFGVDRPVVDRTGLVGTYDIKIEATPEFRIDRDPALSDMSIFTAVQEQLGLRLESQRVPIEILVVDHLEKPSGN